MNGHHSADRKDVFKQLLQELQKAKRVGFRKGPFGFPLLFSVGGGLVIPITERGQKLIELLVLDMWKGAPHLREITSRAEFRKIVEGGLGPHLNGLDLSADRANSAAALNAALEAHVEAAFDRSFGRLEFVYGADLFGSGATPAISIGPVRFEPKASWLERQLASGRISPTSSRRIERAWSQKRLRARIPSHDAEREKAILRTVHDAAYVCSVQTHALSPKVAGDKGRTAARIAMTTIALLWPTTSKTLEWMRLRYDGTSRSNDYFCFGEEGRWGSYSETSGLPHGIYISDEVWRAAFRRHAYLFRVVGRSLTLLCDPRQEHPRNPLIINYYHALWWYWAASKEADSLIALVKFVAALEVLSAGNRRRGGDGRKGILRLLKLRLGVEREQTIFLDGKSTEALIDEIYDSARNRAIHGGNDRLFEDWAPLAARAAAITRMCLLAAAKKLDRDERAQPSRQPRSRAQPAAPARASSRLAGRG